MMCLFLYLIEEIVGNHRFWTSCRFTLENGSVILLQKEEVKKIENFCTLNFQVYLVNLSSPFYFFVFSFTV